MEIKHFNTKEVKTVRDLTNQFNNLGFQAKKLAQATNIIEEMFNDKDCTVFLGLAGAMVPAGMKQIIIDLINNNQIDVLVTTGANLTHDLIEALGHKHVQGSEKADDKELNKQEINRIYNVYMENKVYKDLEDFFNKHFKELSQLTSTSEFLNLLGKLAPKDSILKAAYNQNIPIFCPALSDSGIGLMFLDKKINLNEFNDLNKIVNISWTSKRKGVIYIGGGVPKNYIQQSMQFTKGADYAVQITMDRPEIGGSSGAELKEGISWNKLQKTGKYVNLTCDATIALPIIHTSIKQKL